MSALGEKLNFNPRLREGGDTSYEANDARHFISIHASAKEATDSQTKSTTAAKFQSTPPRRRRLKSPSFDTVSATDFNPRLREGGDRNIL